MVNIRLIPRDNVLLLIKRELINNFVNRVVPEVSPISFQPGTEPGEISFLETRIFVKILWYQEGDEIIHIEIETGSDKNIKIVGPEKKIDRVDTDTQEKDTDMNTGIPPVCHQPGAVFPDCRQFVTDNLADGYICRGVAHYSIRRQKRHLVVRGVRNYKYRSKNASWEFFLKYFFLPHQQAHHD